MSLLYYLSVRIWHIYTIKVLLCQLIACLFEKARRSLIIYHVTFEILDLWTVPFEYQKVKPASSLRLKSIATVGNRALLF
jgi:hypothetical protein